jgi:hypothetical protein
MAFGRWRSYNQDSCATGSTQHEDVNGCQHQITASRRVVTVLGSSIAPYGSAQVALHMRVPASLDMEQSVLLHSTVTEIHSICMHNARSNCFNSPAFLLVAKPQLAVLSLMIEHKRCQVACDSQCGGVHCKLVPRWRLGGASAHSNGYGGWSLLN